jgi:hypothetical protein
MKSNRLGTYYVWFFNHDGKAINPKNGNDRMIYCKTDGEKFIHMAKQEIPVLSYGTTFQCLLSNEMIISLDWQ